MVGEESEAGAAPEADVGAEENDEEDDSWLRTGTYSACATAPPLSESKPSTCYSANNVGCAVVLRAGGRSQLGVARSGGRSGASCGS
eukprot:1182379-Prorocentrum_minimum.AAC.1